MLDLEEHNEERINDVVSQKAATLMRFRRKYGYGYDNQWATLPSLIIQLDDDPEHALMWLESRIEEGAGYKQDIYFVRACPEFPRHGVLESTPADMDTIVDVVKGLQQMMLKEDPNGCLLVQPFIEATSSCVYAPGMYMVIAEGHDGITAGREGITLAFPVYRSYREKYIWEDMGLDPETHELEFVANLEKHMSRDTPENMNKYHMNFSSSDEVDIKLVQIRGCEGHVPISIPPDGVTIQGAIPCGRIEVKQVWVATGLESVPWLEENITKEKCPEGFTVSEPSGSLVSHIMAHCRSVKVPYVKGIVEVGDSWVEPASGWVINDPDHKFEPQPYDPTPYHKEFMRGVEYANKHWRMQHGWFSTFFHQWSCHPYNHPATCAYLAGVFTGWMLKACLGLCLGEMRHAIHNHRKKNLMPSLALFMQSVIGGKKYLTLKDTHCGANIAGNRTPYYYMMEDTVVDWSTMPNIFSILEKAFNTGWSSGYGGKKWGNAAGVAKDTANVMLTMMSHPTEDNVLAMIGKVNLLKDVTHNNGFLYNKFLDKTAFDVGTDGFPSDNLSHLFYVYEMAKDVLDDELVSNAVPPPNDWRVISEFFTKNHTAKYWRENPLFLNEDLPEVLLSEREHLRGRANEIHANSSHNYGDYYNTDTFIPCGDDKCTRCNTFYANLQVKEDLPAEAIDDDGIPYDVWSAGLNPNEEEELLNPAEHTSELLDMITNIKPFPFHQAVSDIVEHWYAAIEEGEDNTEVFKGHVMNITHHVLRWNLNTYMEHQDEVMKLLVKQVYSMWSPMEDSSFVLAYYWITSEWEPDLEILLSNPTHIPSHEYSIYDEDGYLSGQGIMEWDTFDELNAVALSQEVLQAALLAEVVQGMMATSDEDEGE